MAGRLILPRGAITSALPDLLIAPNKTESSAMHPITYIGPLEEWPDFMRDVENSMREFPHSQRAVDFGLQSRDIRLERVYVADETGLQGRFEQAVGQVLGAVFQVLDVDLRFGDSKSAGTGYEKIPDVALMSISPEWALSNIPVHKALGEIKTPWVSAHSIASAYETEWKLGALIGQIVEYMIDEEVPYGFHTTYVETIFLQRVEVDGEWTVQYSPVIGKDLAKQCFWHLAMLAKDGVRIPKPSDTEKLDLICHGPVRGRRRRR